MITYPVNRDFADQWAGERSGLRADVPGHLIINNRLYEASVRYERGMFAEVYLDLHGGRCEFGDDKFAIHSYLLSSDGGVLYLMVELRCHNKTLPLSTSSFGTNTRDALVTIDGSVWRAPAKDSGCVYWRCKETRLSANLLFFVPSSDNVSHLKLTEDLIPMALAKKAEKQRGPPSPVPPAYDDDGEDEKMRPKKRVKK